MTAQVRAVWNGRVFERPESAPPSEFFRWISDSVHSGARLVAFFGTKRAGKGVELTAVLARDSQGRLYAGRTSVLDPTFPSLTPELAQAHLFEREIFEQTGLRPEGHPWLKPVRYSEPGRTPEHTEPYRVEGESVHEVGVGPVHAGIIEPGHFRFQCHGERVFHMEITLGYQHRGIERALREGPATRALHLVETASGDSTIAHTLAHCQALEALSGTRVPSRAQAIRAVALELERVANHVGDLGALAGDVGFLPTASFCGRIRGDFLNLTAELCGNRFGRALVVPGGVRFDLEAHRVPELLRRLETAFRESQGAVDLLFDAVAVRTRFEDTGVVSAELAKNLGLVGPAARASGLERDVRTDHPTGIYQFHHVPAATAEAGDVMARARVRWLEVMRSVLFVRELLQALPAGETRAEQGLPAPNRMVVSLAEGWRGETAHLLGTGDDGKTVTSKIVDPSFHNWMGLQMALRGEEISDFPICNKSFNLSYCGHDL